MDGVPPAWSREVMDPWADDFGLAPADPHRRRDPRRVVIAALVAVTVVVAVTTVVVRGDDRPHRIAAAEDPTGDPTTTTTPDPTTTTSTTGPESTTTTTAPGPASATGSERPPEGAMSRYTLEAVTPSGAPIPGLFVYVTDTLERNLRTDAAGRVALDCIVGEPADEFQTALLSGVQLNYMFGDHSGDQNWAPTPVDPSLVQGACGTPDPVVVTMRPGATLHVSFSDPTDRQREYYESSFIRVAVSLDGQELPIEGRPQCLPICYEVEGSSGPPWTDVTIVGLPAGEVLAWIHPEDPCRPVLVPVVLQAGQTTELASVLSDSDGDCSSNDPPPTG